MSERSNLRPLCHWTTETNILPELRAYREHRLPHRPEGNTYFSFFNVNVTISGEVFELTFFFYPRASSLLLEV